MIPRDVAQSTARGAASIDDRVFGVGLTAAAALLLVERSTTPTLAFAGTSAASPAGSVIAAIAGTTAGGVLGTGLSWGAVGLIAAGVAGAGGAVVAADDDSSSGSTVNPSGIVVDLVEAPDGVGGTTGCFSGTVRLTADNQLVGQVLELRGEGAAADGLGGSAPWNRIASTTIDNSGRATLEIPLARHCDCLDGRVVVTLDGQPAVFEFALSGASLGTFNGSVPSNCF